MEFFQRQEDDNKKTISTPTVTCLLSFHKSYRCWQASISQGLKLAPGIKPVGKENMHIISCTPYSKVGLRREDALCRSKWSACVNQSAAGLR